MTVITIPTASSSIHIDEPLRSLGLVLTSIQLDLLDMEIDDGGDVA